MNTHKCLRTVPGIEKVLCESWLFLLLLFPPGWVSEGHSLAPWSKPGSRFPYPNFSRTALPWMYLWEPLAQPSIHRSKRPRYGSCQKPVLTPKTKQVSWSPLPDMAGRKQEVEDDLHPHPGFAVQVLGHWLPSPVHATLDHIPAPTPLPQEVHRWELQISALLCSEACRGSPGPSRRKPESSYWPQALLKDPNLAWVMGPSSTGESL